LDSSLSVFPVRLPRIQFKLFAVWGIVWLSVCSVLFAQSDPRMGLWLSQIEANDLLIENNGGRIQPEVLELEQQIDSLANISHRIYVRNKLGLLYKHAGRFDESRQLFETSLSLASTPVMSVERIETIIELADLDRWTGDVYGGLDRAAKLLAGEFGSPSNVQRIEVLNVMGVSYRKTREFQKAVDKFREAIILAERTIDCPLILRHKVNYNSGLANRELKDFDQAIVDLKSAREFAIELNDRKAEGSCVDEIAYIYRKQGKYLESIEYCEKAERIHESVRDFAALSNIYRYYSIIYHHLGDYDKAISYGIECIRMAETASHAVSTINAYLNMANILDDFGEYDEALKYVQEGLAVCENTGNTSNIGFAYKNMGSIYAHLNEPERAIQYLKQSLDFHTLNDDLTSIATTWFRMGKVYRSAGESASALLAFAEALESFTKAQDSWGKAETSIEYGSMLLNEHKDENALALIKEGIEIAKKINAIQLQSKAYKLLSRYYSDQQNFQESDRWGGRFISLQSKIDAQNNRTRLSNLNILFSIEKKEREIGRLETEQKLSEMAVQKKESEIELLKREQRIKDLSIERNKTFRYLWFGIIGLLLIILVLLVHRNRVARRLQLILMQTNLEIGRKNSELEGINETKNQFFSIIAHDLRQLIGNIAYSLKMLDDDSIRIKEPDYRRMISSLKISSGNTLLLLDNLLGWAKHQMHGLKIIHESMLLLEETNSVINFFDYELKKRKMNLYVEVDAALQVWCDRNILLTVLRNLVHNALKFTPQGGSIWIRANQVEDGIEVHVCDTGMGFDTTKTQLVSTAIVSGEMTEKGAGMGLMLCGNLLKEMGSELKVFSRPQKGSDFSFVLKTNPS
jgi:signal transduction histidine kinase